MSTQIRIKAWRYHKGGELPAVLQQDDIEVTQPKKGEVSSRVMGTPFTSVAHNTSESSQLLLFPF